MLPKIPLQELQTGFREEARRTGKGKLLLTLAAAGGTYFISKSYEPQKIVQYAFHVKFRCWYTKLNLTNLEPCLKVLLLFSIQACP